MNHFGRQPHSGHGSGPRIRVELVEGLPPAARTTPVARVMERVLMEIDPNTGLRELMRRFVEFGVHAAPVVDADGVLLGVVSKNAVLEHLCEHPNAADSEPPVVDGARGAVARRFDRPGAPRVIDVMNRLGPVVTEQTSLAKAAEVMVYGGVHPVPVVDAEGQVTGTLSSLNLLRWLARNDAHMKP